MSLLNAHGRGRSALYRFLRRKKFYAIETATGQVRWSYDIKQDGKQLSFHGDPLVLGDLILIGTDHSCEPGGIGHVYAFEHATGKVRWKHRSTNVPTDIVQLRSKLYFGSIQDTWSSFDLQTQRVNWTFALATPNPDCHLPRPPVVYKERILIGGLDGIIYSVDSSSGRVAWKNKLPAAPSTAMVVRDKSIYLGTRDNKVYRLDADSGRILDQTPTDAKPFGRLVFNGDKLLMFVEDASTKSGYLVALDPNLKMKWKQKAAPEWASERPHLWKGNIIAGNCRGDVGAFRAPDGEPQWKLSVKGCVRSIGSSDNMLFVGAQEGTVYAFKSSSK